MNSPPTLPSIREAFPEHFPARQSDTAEAAREITADRPPPPSYTCIAGGQTNVTQLPGTVAQPQWKHVCTTCGTRFQRPSSLEIHERSHTGERPFECTYPGCRRRYMTVSNLHRHRRHAHGRMPA